MKSKGNTIRQQVIYDASQRATSHHTLSKPAAFNDSKYTHDHDSCKLSDIPRHIRWMIEKDYHVGAQTLADTIARRVTVVLNIPHGESMPKNTLKKVNGPGGYAMTWWHTHSTPKPLVFTPTQGEVPLPSKDKGVVLHVIPNKTHYLQTSEQRKKPAHGCPCCLWRHTSTAVTIGQGKKSARKTKGRQKREQYQIHIASNGYL